jgi:hypothetical protein
MPIRRFLGNRVFDPDETHAMGEAFEIVCDLLELKPGTDDPMTRKVAGAIVGAAESGIRDTEGLMAAALDTLGIPQRIKDEKRPH